MTKRDNLTILAIETSCDDTCAAILKIVYLLKPISSDTGRWRNWKLEILSNVISSQVKLHAKYGGVYPTLAKREHQKNLLPVLETVLEEAKNPEINLIAVTVGPGLEPCLWVGVNFSRALAKEFRLPMIPVNHIEAHILVNWLQPINQKSKIQIKNKKIEFPAICLVASGGHTQLILMKGIGKYKILGETRDDAAGECFDKIARILGLGYPGGPIIAKMAMKIKNQKRISSSQTKTKIKNIKLPRPMIHQKNYDFSFSGLKTAVLYNYRQQPLKIQKSREYIQQMAFEAQQAIIDVLVSKTIRAAKDYQAKTIILGGGVAANQELKRQMKEKAKRLNYTFRIPKPKFCIDNAAMVGITAFFHWLKGEQQSWKKIKADANLRIQ